MFSTSMFENETENNEDNNKRTCCNKDRSARGCALFPKYMETTELSIVHHQTLEKNVQIYLLKLFTRNK